MIANIAAERLIIGRMLLAESNYCPSSDILRAEHFSAPIHQRIYGAIRDVLGDGKKLSLAVVQSKVGEEYDDGKSVMSLMTALMRNAEDADGGDLDDIEDVIDKWRHRTLIATLESDLKAAKKADASAIDLIASHAERLQEITLNSQSEPLKTMGQLAVSVMTKSGKTNSTGIAPGFDTGLPSLDEILGRIHPGDLGFVGASAGDGKTLMAAQLAMRAQQYVPALYFQLEMTGEDMAARRLATETGLSVAEIESGAYDAFHLDELRVASEKLQNARVYIDDRPKLRIDQIWDRCRAVKRSKGLGFIVVDHIRLVGASGRYQNRFDKVEHVTGELKALAKDLGIAVCALSQVTRASQRRDDPIPRLNDFDGGSSIEQDADWALSLFRRDRWLRQQRPQEMDSAAGRKWAEDMQKCKGRIEVTCLKRRRGEDGERRDFEFDGRRGLFREIDK